MLINNKPALNKVALVTGAARGIGEAIALRLAEDGFDLVVNDVAANSIQSKSVADQIIKLGRRAIVISCDVSDSIAVDAMLCEIVKEFKRLDVCCANAGVARVGSLLNSTPEERKLIFDINLHGVMNTSIAAAKQMKLQGTGGRIIPTVSIVAIRPFPMLSTYSASKWAVKGFVQAAAMEWASDGIRVNGVCPGIVGTDMWDLIDKELGKETGKAIGETRSGYVKDLVALGRVSVPSDVSKLVSFLASDDSEYITGQSIPCDGGVSFV